LSFKKIVISLFFCLIFLNCETINYKFVEKLYDKSKLEFFDKIKDYNPFGKTNVKINGIYTVKNKSYKFEAIYNIKNNSLELKFYSLLSKKDLLFDVRYEKNKIYFDYFIRTFYYLEIINIVNKFIYTVNIIPQQYEIYNTSDDYYVIVDKDKNYQKYDSYNIIKKENIFQRVRYYYEKDKLKRIEYKKFLDLTIFIIEEMVLYE